jgi:hypothetical protein
VKLPASTSSERPSSAVSGPSGVRKDTRTPSRRTARPASPATGASGRCGVEWVNAGSVLIAQASHGAPPRDHSLSAGRPDPAGAERRRSHRSMRRRNASRSPSPIRTVTVGPGCRRASRSLGSGRPRRVLRTHSLRAPGPSGFAGWLRFSGTDRRWGLSPRPEGDGNSFSCS